MGETAGARPVAISDMHYGPQLRRFKALTHGKRLMSSCISRACTARSV